MVHTLLTSYLQGVFSLKEMIEKDGRDYELLSILQIRLKENIGRAQMYGETSENRADRMVILHELNGITERSLGCSFVDFCQSDKLQDRHKDVDIAPTGASIEAEKKKPLTEPVARIDKMNPARREALKEALLSAFPTPGSLQQMVAFYLRKNLTVIAGGNDYDTIVFNLIMWTEAHGETEKLIAGARQINPGNSNLRKFEEQ